MAHSGDSGFGDIDFGAIDFGGLCFNGHDVPRGASYCPACGSPATPPTGAAPASPDPGGPVWTPRPAPTWTPSQYRAPAQFPLYGQLPPPPRYAQPAPAWGQPGYGRRGYGPGVGYGWPRPVWAPAPWAGASVNGAAVAALILGVAGFLGLFGIGSLAAVICGHIGINQTARRGQRGRGAAVAGLVLGYLGLAFAVFVVAIAVSSL